MLLTAKELATALDVHITTIRRAYRKKTIPFEKLCKLYFFDLEKVRHAMRQGGSDLLPSEDHDMRRATGGDSRRRAQTISPRSVKRGRNFSKSTRRRA